MFSIELPGKKGCPAVAMGQEGGGMVATEG